MLALKMKDGNSGENRTAIQGNQLSRRDRGLSNRREIVQRLESIHLSIPKLLKVMDSGRMVHSIA